MNAIQRSRILKPNFKSGRIQRSLYKLKHLILESMLERNEDISQINNRDILELAVGYVKQTHQSSFGGQFLRGYINATNEVSFALSHLPQIDKSAGNQIIARLENQLTYNLIMPVCPLESPSSSGYASDCESNASDLCPPC